MYATAIDSYPLTHTPSRRVAEDLAKCNSHPRDMHLGTAAIRLVLLACEEVAPDDVVENHRLCAGACQSAAP